MWLSWTCIEIQYLEDKKTLSTKKPTLNTNICVYGSNKNRSNFTAVPGNSGFHSPSRPCPALPTGCWRPCGWPSEPPCERPGSYISRSGAPGFQRGPRHLSGLRDKEHGEINQLIDNTNLTGTLRRQTTSL